MAKSIIKLGILLYAIASSAMAAPSSPLTVGEHNARMGGLLIHYQVAGHGPALVVQAPGWGIGTTYLARGLEPLQKHFTVVTYDPRGTGGSTPVSSHDHLTNEDLVGDLEQLRRYWGLPTMKLLGHSNGGAISILYAEKYPDHVEKLVLVGTQLLGYSAPRDATAKAEAIRRKASPDFSWLNAHINDTEPTDDKEYTEYFRQRVGFFVYDPRKYAPIIARQLSNTMSASVHQAFEESPPVEQSPPLSDLSKITAKTLIVVGRQDPVCPLAESETIHRSVQGSRLVAIDQAGHFLWVEKPDEFFDAVNTFLLE